MTVRIGRFVAISVVALASLFPALTRAQDYPTRPVTLVVPFASGGGLDMIARQLQPLIEARLGKPLVIENKPGAGTMIGAAYVAKAAPDGYTILFGSASPLAIAVNVNKDPLYDPAKDFVPISMIGNAAFVFVVSPTLGVSTLADFIKLAKEKPGQLSFGSGGTG
ncbi:MAG: Bug family tripartite tricarboxylate transporter substrate binding protein, partial [Xanthobacteraceae bacterium]